MKSWEELNQRRDEERSKISLRRSEAAVKIIVGGGTRGIAAGARAITSTTLDEILRHHLEGKAVVQLAAVEQEGCEPLVRIEQPGKEPVVYQNVTPERMQRIFQQHVLNGEVVKEWVMAS
ncbi:MAG TPA: (2Fe-2S) ferredoxin domain-containing protein [Firmicutes bacterium]|jgi:NADP-reducing hydrogenase subunit HndB|nr:(2Fe-2S) ferredoxin domain-containing protein [Bacillota bacterium]HOQ24753.1 (2Fe-2S) ferredoxin domain-containing protein [Bacillota bacterium]HPT67448.1 (2Fe-2S) ferredoxin domain-containing protein [Bacillota bacterium]